MGIGKNALNKWRWFCPFEPVSLHELTTYTSSYKSFEQKVLPQIGDSFFFLNQSCTRRGNHLDEKSAS